MKLRIKGDSLRLRVTPAEVSRLMEMGRVEETIHFGTAEGARLTYALEHADVRKMAVRHEPAGVAVVVPTEDAQAWAAGEDVGIYGDISLATGRLELAVEKDWACLDRRDAGDADTFPNPKKDC